MLKISKKVKEGCLVRIRKDKIIICNNIKRAVGIYTKGETRLNLTMEGKMVWSSHPEGIVVKGPVDVRVSK